MHHNRAAHSEHIRPVSHFIRKLRHLPAVRTSALIKSLRLQDCAIHGVSCSRPEVFAVLNHIDHIHWSHAPHPKVLIASH